MYLDDLDRDLSIDDEDRDLCPVCEAQIQDLSISIDYLGRDLPLDYLVGDLSLDYLDRDLSLDYLDHDFVRRVKTLGPRCGGRPQEGARGRGGSGRHGFAGRHAPRHRNQEQVARQHRRQSRVPPCHGYQRRRRGRGRRFLFPGKLCFDFCC